MKRFFLIAAMTIGIAGTALAGTTGLSQNEQLSETNSRLHGGLGIGMMYGEAGANIEYRLTNQLSATTGIGLNGDGQWFVGGRYYFKPEGHGPRGRFTLGVANSSDDIFSDDDNVTKGIIAIGWTWANKDNGFKGFDIDVTTNGGFSVGYHF
ncbi:MAG TPA: hypothetical protein VHV83_10775 [Armatimonadota bacterium]|nr:hypothetical protein [Armatimonadota bacterium]